jgi:DNA-binding beta-propeller fold protein YncE
VSDVFGDGEPGWQDGPSHKARFRAPHGLSLAGNTLYVADTENHLVRAIDLGTREVTTLAGTGVQARPFSDDGPAREVSLNSPWDVLCFGRALYVAMAGSHQLWRIDMARGWAEVYAGSGAEALHDAPLSEAALAQPSALSSDGERLYFTDPEASAVRSASTRDGVATLVGTGLFDSGDRDGVGDEVRLQHALGLAWWRAENKLLLADSYNHRIKLVDPRTRETIRLSGSGETGLADGSAGQASSWEPGGVTVSPSGRRVFVADTNNHRIRAIDLASGAVTTVVISQQQDVRAPTEARLERQ